MTRKMDEMKNYIRAFFFVVLYLGMPVLTAPNAYGQEENTKNGLRVYHIGNSLTHSIRNDLMPLAHAAGHPGHTYSWSSILGAPLRWIRDHDEQSGGWEGEPWSKGLAANRSWDALTLQAFAEDDKEVAAAVHFAGLAYQGNPRCQVYLYTSWPSADRDWENPPLGRSEGFTEKCAEAIAAAYPNSPRPRVIPSRIILQELGRLADEGLLPPLQNRFALLSDNIHLSKYGSYAVNVLICSMMYNESPFAHPARIGGFKSRSFDSKVIDLEKIQYEIPEETASVIKRMVWEVLSTYPPAGIDVGLVIADRRLPAVVVGQSFSYTLRSLNAKGDVRWSLAAGTLPKGIRLTKNGILEGTAKETGKYGISLKVQDAQKSFVKDFRLLVNEDLPPKIVTTELPAIRLDEYFFKALQAEGGVGHLTWTVASGGLPHGIALRKPGILVGTPGQAGEYVFEVQATDSYLGQSRSVRRKYTWTILPASPQTLLAKKVQESIKLDGKLDESCWSDLRPIAKTTGGSPVHNAFFTAVWTHQNKAGGKGSIYLAVKIENGPEAKSTLDSIELFIDALHNREVVYNADDGHFKVGRDGRTQSVRGKPEWFIKSAVREFDGGIAMEIEIPSTYFEGQGQWVPFGGNAVYGFDIAVNSGQGGENRLLWQGTENNADDTSGFGTLVLTE